MVQLTLFQQDILLFNITSFIVVSIVTVKSGSIPLFLSLFLFTRYYLYLVFYYENIGTIVEFLGSSLALVIAVYMHETGLYRILYRHLLLNQTAKTILLIMVSIMVTYDYIVDDNITMYASITYMILLLPVIYYFILDKYKTFTMLMVYTVFVLLASSDIRELVNLFWLYIDIHWFELLLKEQFLIWVTALISLYKYCIIRVKRGSLIVSLLVLALGNILQVPPILYYIDTYNPYNIWSYIIRLTPLPLLFALKIRGGKPYESVNTSL